MAYFRPILEPLQVENVLRRPIFGLLESVPFWAGFPGSRKKPKKCTFFWVFNNSPSRDSLSLFFPPRFWDSLGQFGVSQLTCRISGGSMTHLCRSMSQPISSMSQPMCVGSVIMLSLRLYVSVIANVCHTHCVGDNIIAIVCHTHCECISLSLR